MSHGEGEKYKEGWEGEKKKIKRKKQKEKEDKKEKKNKKKAHGNEIYHLCMAVCFLLEVRTHVFAKTPLEPS